MYNKILIDVSNIYHKAYSVFTETTHTSPSGEIIHTGGIAGFLKSLKKIEHDFLSPLGSIYFLFDNALSVEDRRKQIDPEYKINRYKKDPIFYRGLDYLHLILLSHKNGNFVFRNPGSEADDLVDAVIQSFDKDDRVLLVSGDKDWARGLKENVDWFFSRPKDPILMNREKFEEHYGYKPTRQRICMYKSFRGDAGDHIPAGVPGINKEVLIRLINEFDNFNDMFLAIRNNSILYLSDTWKQNILAGKGRLLLNMRLVDYIEVEPDGIADNLLPTSFEPKTLKRLYELMGFDIAVVDPRPELAKTVTVKPAKGNSFFIVDDLHRL